MQDLGFRVDLSSRVFGMFGKSRPFAVELWAAYMLRWEFPKIGDPNIVPFKQ